MLLSKRRATVRPPAHFRMRTGEFAVSGAADPWNVRATGHSSGLHGIEFEKTHRACFSTRMRSLRNAATCLSLLVFLPGCPRTHVLSPAEILAQSPATWTKLETAAYRGKQDDIVFLDAENGFYVNGGGKIFRTADGGATWA